MENPHLQQQDGARRGGVEQRPQRLIADALGAEGDDVDGPPQRARQRRHLL